MAKFSLCIEPVLTDYDFCDRIKIAAELGYDAIEFWDPSDKDLAKIADTAAKNNIDVAICCVNKAWDIRMNFPVDEVIANIKKSVEMAKILGTKSMIGLSGDVGENDGRQTEVLIENLKRVSDILVKEDVTLCLEALNSLVDHKGYYLDSTKVGFEIVRAVGCDKVKLLYDVYHMQIMEGNIIDTIKANHTEIGHFHSAGVPGRNEHHNGENDYRNILKSIEKTGYNKYFGLEYWTTYDAKESLKDCLAYLRGE